MLLHIRPQLFFPFSEAVEIVELRLDPWGLQLRGGIDLVARRPYPNKRYNVACRRQRRKAIDGILVQVANSAVDEFHYTARWAICTRVWSKGAMRV